MRRCKILVVAVSASLLAFGAVGVFAQLDKLKNTTPEERAAIQTEFMKAKLALTPDQTRAVADLNLEYAKRMDPVINSSSGDFAKMLKMRQINNEKEARLKGVLSADQWRKFEASRDEMREKFEEKIEEDAGRK